MQTGVSAEDAVVRWACTPAAIQTIVGYLMRVILERFRSQAANQTSDPPGTRHAQIGASTQRCARCSEGQLAPFPEKTEENSMRKYSAYSDRIRSAFCSDLETNLRIGDHRPDLARSPQRSATAIQGLLNPFFHGECERASTQRSDSRILKHLLCITIRLHVQGLNPTIRLADTETKCKGMRWLAYDGLNPTIRLADTETRSSKFDRPASLGPQPNDPTRGY